MLTDLLPLLRWTEVRVGELHGFLGRWVALWEPEIGHGQSVTDPPAPCPVCARSVPDPEAIGHAL
jgi:hypothetical protein